MKFGGQHDNNIVIRRRRREGVRNHMKGRKGSEKWRARQRVRVWGNKKCERQHAEGRADG